MSGTEFNSAILIHVFLTVFSGEDGASRGPERQEEEGQRRALP